MTVYVLVTYDCCDGETVLGVVTSEGDAQAWVSVEPNRRDYHIRVLDQVDD